MNFQFKNCGKNQNPISKDGISGVDPAGFAPASPLVNGGMLLHTSRTRIHEITLKQKGVFFKNPFC